MKKRKKIISMLLIVMLMSVQLIPMLNVRAEDSFVITTYGSNEDGVNPNLVTNKAGLTVSGIENGDELSAYKIIDSFYSEQANEITYEFTTNFKNFLNQNEDYGDTFTIDDYFELTSDPLDNNGQVSNSVITTSTLNVLVSKYATYIANNNIESDESLVTSGTNATAQVEVGSYLILSNSHVKEVIDEDWGGLRFEKYLYGVMVGNVVITTNQNTNQWELNDCTVVAKNSNGHFTTTFWSVSIEDVLSGNIDDDLSMVGNTVSTTYTKAKTLVIDVCNSNLPTNAINKTTKLEIEIPEGISYDKDKIYRMDEDITPFTDGKLLDDNGNELATITFNGQNITIIFNAENAKDTITIMFDVRLNEKSIVGNEGNEIVATFTNIDDPYVLNSFTTSQISNIVTTYGLELTSLSKDDSTLLKGAKYEIYSKYTDSVLSNKIGEFTVGDDGNGSFPGVPSGTVYLKQVKAPTGYQLIKEPIAVKIATEDATAGTKEGYYQVITYNDAMWYLPSTGGIGTILYTVIGLLVISLSTYSIVYYRKKKVANI